MILPPIPRESGRQFTHISFSITIIIIKYIGVLIIWAKALFFFEQLFPVVVRTWLGAKSVCLFLGPKFQFLAKKSDFCHTTPIFVDDPFLALDMTVNFPPWKRFFDFSFRSYSCFRKKIRLTAQKVFPPPTYGSSVCQ